MDESPRVRVFTPQQAGDIITKAEMLRELTDRLVPESASQPFSGQVTREDLCKVARDAGLPESLIHRVIALEYPDVEPVESAYRGMPTASVVCDMYKHYILAELWRRRPFNDVGSECSRCDRDRGSKHKIDFFEVYRGFKQQRRLFGLVPSIEEWVTERISLAHVIIGTRAITGRWDKEEKNYFDIAISAERGDFLSECQDTLGMLRKKFDDYTHSYKVEHVKVHLR